MSKKKKKTVFTRVNSVRTGVKNRGGGFYCQGVEYFWKDKKCRALFFFFFLVKKRGDTFRTRVFLPIH